MLMTQKYLHYFVRKNISGTQKCTQNLSRRMDNLEHKGVEGNILLKCTNQKQCIKV